MIWPRSSAVGRAAPRVALREPQIGVRNPPNAEIALFVWAAALLLIPSTLQFAPLGAAGTPAQILGLVAAAWWFGVQIGRTQQPDVGRAVPTRLAMGIFALAMLLGYVAAVSRPVEAIE